jgi:uncharacterized radical SAM superfamily Fe-S cluster-containing enzyme/prolipoprotein diacylglyceryltransferase
MNWTYVAIMAAAVLTGFFVYLRTREPLGLSAWETLGVGLGAFCGGMIGAKLPFLLADWEGFISGTAWLHGGKTIMAGLVGGYFGVQVAEWSLGIRAKMCDSFAAPVAAAVAVGRLACFQAGCCYGTVTSLPWGVDFGDGQLRHPTQLYESAFHLVAAVVLYRLQRRQILRGQLIRVYFVGYFVYRFATEFIRPEPALWLGLTGYQWAALVLAPFFAVWSCPHCNPIRLGWQRRRLRKARAGDSTYHVLKETRTLCPTCLRPVLGTTFERDGKVYLKRECPEHGAVVALLSSDRRHYYLRDEVPHPPLATKKCCCGAPGHRTCVALLELTEACNLRCPVCFAQSPSGEHRRFEDLCADLEGFLDARGSLDVLQLSGGEPLLHPDLLRVIDHAKTLPIDHVMINTNGLELVRSETLAGELARRTPRLELFLQMDGLDVESHLALRGADLLEQKRAVIQRIIENDLPTTLVCTVAKGVNEHQLGELVRLGLATRPLRGITFQPATWSGRFDRSTDPLDRVTAADVVRLLVDESGGLLREDDFKPLPCSNPNCCGFTFVFRPRRGRIVPLTRLVNYEDHLDRLSDRINFNLEDVRAYGGAGRRPDEFFRLVIKPFMDAYTYDRDRIDECCIHIIRPGGQAVSFCQFNIVERQPASHQAAGVPEETYDLSHVRA